ncbi:nucleoside hydrolase [Streptomyces sp. NBC_01766]|uniref:nucleoside hydrolase n=1 Tax=Streptomyces sp. NBC_01766 TaxID=2975936 RepID=UPI002DD820C3|nr:nucleoside hydrolase [Streptomyces sp. NBC_01766]WSC18225.1 nucleoside hydrolase [Streptomyces sp. NBC_01766]
MNHPLAAVPEGITADVLLDTDIGSDVDDALALGVLLGSPEARITGVTTVYGDTLLRARLTHRLGALAGRDLTVVPGAKDTLSGKDVWWAGHEGKAFTDLEREPVREDTAADRFLVDSVLARPGEIDVIGIAPLANIARAIRLDDRFAAGVRGLYLMGGSFGPDARPEHNIVSDITAARVVFGSGIRTVVTGLEITTRLRIESAGIETIRGAGAYGEALAREIDGWTGFTGEPWSVPHDPITALSLLRPDLYTTERGTVEITDDGLTVFTADPNGNVDLEVDADVEAIAEEIVARIVRASGPLD